MILGSVCYYGAFVLIILQALQGSISIGDLTFLSASFSRLQSNFQGILSRFSQIAQNALYLRDLFEFLAIEPQVISPKKPIKIPQTIQQGFTFENVGFNYPNSEKWAVRNLNFTLKAGEKLALVGENGAGKTTVVKLLSRLYDCTEGRILLDNVDIKEYDLQELRLLIGVIFQDFVRFQLNISDNIAVGMIDDRENEAKITNAARLSLADSVVAKFPQGYQQLLGKRFSQKGVELSGGEWQKVALARAYMREAQLIILDEPTAALDARAEFEVFQRFAELTAGKTAVLISHRFSTVRMADRIMVLQKGRQIEMGSHEELLEKNGVYAELFRLQAQGYQ
jgi:ATP-binding cassette subfamily B protein